MRSFSMLIVSVALLSGCSMPYQSAASSSAGRVLSTRGNSQAILVPGRADMDAFVLGRELRDVDEQIDNLRGQGAVSKREARSLRRQSGQLSDLADRYGADGLSSDEKRELETRTQLLRDQTAAQVFGPVKPD